MKRLSRVLILLLAFVLAFSFAACGKKAPQTNTQTASVSITEATEAPAQTETPAPEKTREPAVTDLPEETPAETETPEAPALTEEPSENGITVTEDGEYTDKEHVALYLHTYGHLPSNYITKKDAKAAGWDSGAGNLIKVCPSKSIGGDRFGNYEGLLPDQNGRKYYECDINYNPEGKTSGRVTRGPERIIFSNDGLIFYTDDHYNTFEQLY